MPTESPQATATSDTHVADQHTELNAVAREGLRRLLPHSAAGALLRVIQLGPVLMLIALAIVTSLLSSYFFTSLNLSNLLLASVVVAVLAIGQLLVMLTGGIDISAGGVVVLTGLVGVKVSHATGHSAAIVVPAMLATGAGVGLVNGLLVEKARLASPFVVTLGTFSVVQGLGYVLSNGATITGFPHVIVTIGSGYVGRIPNAALVVVAVALLAWVMTSRLRWGRWIYAVGGNRDAATRGGLPVEAISISVFVFSGLAAAIGGIFTVGLTNSAAPSGSFNALLDAVSAVVIGGAALTGGRGTVWGTIVGALILGTVHNALNLLNVDTNWEPVVLGCVLILAVAMDHLRGLVETRLRLVEARRMGDL